MPRDYMAVRDYLSIDDRIIYELRKENQHLTALDQNGQSAIDTNKRLVEKIKDLQYSLISLAKLTMHCSTCAYKNRSDIIKCVRCECEGRNGYWELDESLLIDE